MGMFAKGLVKGLAGSIDRNLQMAISRRQDDVSRAKTFWMTRQAQKLDAADEHDRMAEKHLNRLINEFGGDVSKGLAAYKALGGDVDSVGKYIDDLDETRQAGISYNIADKFKFDGVDLSQFADLSRKQALGAVSMEIKPLDIQYTDTSGLSKIGLGLKDAGKDISASVNQLIPERDFAEVRALTDTLRGKFDPSGLKAGVEFSMKQQQHRATMAANIPSLEKQLSQNILEIAKTTDSDKLKKLQDKQTLLITTIESVAKAKDPSSGEVSISVLSRSYDNMLDQTESSAGFTLSGGRPQIINPTTNVPAFDSEALEIYAPIKKAAEKRFIINNILNADQTAFRSKDAEAMVRLKGLSSLVDEVLNEAKLRRETEEALRVGEASDEIGDAELFDPTRGVDTREVDTTVVDEPPMNNVLNEQEVSALEGTTFYNRETQSLDDDAIKANPDAFVDFFIGQNPLLRSNEGAEAVGRVLLEAGVPEDVVRRQIQRIKDLAEIGKPKGQGASVRKKSR